MDQTWIDVTITPDGEIQLEAHGYEGLDCLEATRALEEALGHDAQRQLKPEAQRRRVKAPARATQQRRQT